MLSPNIDSHQATEHHLHPLYSSTNTTEIPWAPPYYSQNYFLNQEPSLFHRYSTSLYPPAPSSTIAIRHHPTKEASVKTNTVCDITKMFETFHSSGEFKASFYNPFEIKHRKRTSRQQVRILEKAFQENNKPNNIIRRELAAKLGMTARGVQVWFQNRRAKMKTCSKDAKREPNSLDIQYTDMEENGEEEQIEEQDQQQVEALQNEQESQQIKDSPRSKREATAGPSVGVLTFARGEQVYRDVRLDSANYNSSEKAISKIASQQQQSHQRVASGGKSLTAETSSWALEKIEPSSTTFSCASFPASLNPDGNIEHQRKRSSFSGGHFPTIAPAPARRRISEVGVSNLPQAGNAAVSQSLDYPMLSNSALYSLQATKQSQTATTVSTHSEGEYISLQHSPPFYSPHHPISAMEGNVPSYYYPHTSHLQPIRDEEGSNNGSGNAQPYPSLLNLTSGKSANSSMNNSGHEYGSEPYMFMASIPIYDETSENNVTLCNAGWYPHHHMSTSGDYNMDNNTNCSSPNSHQMEEQSQHCYPSHWSVTTSAMASESGHGDNLPQSAAIFFDDHCHSRPLSTSPMNSMMLINHHHQEFLHPHRQFKPLQSQQQQMVHHHTDGGMISIVGDLHPDDVSYPVW